MLLFSMGSSRLRSYFYLLIVVLIWGVAPAVIKFALGELPPFLFLTYRFAVTTLFTLPFYLASHKKWLSFSNLALVLITSFLGSTVNLGLLFYGTNLTTSLDSSLISATSPIFVILAGIIFLRERITKRERFGVAIAILGTTIVALQSFFEQGTNVPHSVYGNFILFLSNAAFAAYLILSKKALQKGVNAFTITFMMFFVGFFTTLPLAIKEVGFTHVIPKIMNAGLGAHLSVFYMAILSGAVAYYLYQTAQKSIEASEASIFNYLPPIVTAPVGILWLHEKLTIPYLIGSAVIAMGVILAEWKNSRKKV